MQRINKALKAKIDALTPVEQDEVYRYLWFQHVKEDVETYSENIDLKELGIKFDDEEITTVAEKYVYDGEYDCNLSYWDNIENLIYEVTDYRNIANRTKEE